MGALVHAVLPNPACQLALLGTNAAVVVMCCLLVVVVMLVLPLTRVRSPDAQ
jgi:hypothetical protein